MNRAAHGQQMEENLLLVILPNRWIHSGVRKALWGCLSVLIGPSVLDNPVAKVATASRYLLRDFRPTGRSLAP